jgi:hypothetical protein
MTRGRPPKFGRPAKLVALTLPRDVLNWLHTINGDPAWAIVSLFERSAKNRPARREPAEQAQLVRAGRHALIVVDPTVVGKVPGVSLVPLRAGRSFFALQPGKGLADLEVAVLDRLEEPSLSELERRGLEKLRRDLREWRQDRELNFETRSIIVVRRQRKASSARTKLARDGGDGTTRARSARVRLARPPLDPSVPFSATFDER